MILNKADLLKAMELKRETVEIDGGEVIVTEIGAADLVGLYSRPDIQAADGGVIMKKFAPALVSMCVVDENGNRLFSDEDINLLENAAASVFTKIATVARRLNGLSGDDAKN